MVINKEREHRSTYINHVISEMRSFLLFVDLLIVLTAQHIFKAFCTPCPAINICWPFSFLG
jgi:hypothetical protein